MYEIVDVAMFFSFPFRRFFSLSLSHTVLIFFVCSLPFCMFVRTFSRGRAYGEEMAVNGNKLLCWFLW